MAIEIDSKDPNYYYSRAIVKNELYTCKSALKDYDKAIEIAPEFVSALINRGGLKDENKDYKGAIADYETVLKLDNLEAEEKQQAYFNSGNTYFKLKDKKLLVKIGIEHWKTVQIMRKKELKIIIIKTQL